MTLDDWRAHLDSIDHALAALLDERFRVVEEIGALKRASGLPVVDEARERAVLARVATIATRREPVVELFRWIILASREHQR
jgi:chorismate mutase